MLDLRNNPGGLLTAAVEVAERFLEPGQLVVYTEGRVRNQNMRFQANARKIYSGFPIVVLVNQGSASASEIVAGALQDWGRGIVLGTQTFGKGSVQTIIPLSDGSGLRLTTAKYFTPKGRTIHGKGVTPDIIVELPKASPATAAAPDAARPEGKGDAGKGEGGKADPSKPAVEGKPEEHQARRAAPARARPPQGHADPRQDADAHVGAASRRRSSRAPAGRRC